MNLFGIPVIESPLAALPEPNRVHKHRRNQSDTYHRRVQKKWNKRFGMTLKPAVIFINPGIVGLWGRDTLIAHPTVLGVIRNIGTKP